MRLPFFTMGQLSHYTVAPIGGLAPLALIKARRKAARREAAQAFFQRLAEQENPNWLEEEVSVNEDVPGAVEEARTYFG